MKKIFMKKTLIGVCLFVFIPAATLPAAEKKAPELPGWTLVWEDEFEGDKLDTTKWRAEDAALVKNNEKQYYSPDEVILKNGILTLRSQKKQKGGRPYTSGLIETKGKFSQMYGRFETRAKLPKGQGIWPAHWLMNLAGTWPPEIDIMELLGHEPHTVYMTNHYGIYPKNKLEGQPFSGPDFSEDFHTFALEWEEKELRWYVDGVKQFSTKKNVPQDIKFYLIINTAVGGDWPGYPDATTHFPQYHEIDYVRVYKRDIEGTRILMTSAENGYIRLDPDLSRYEKGSIVHLNAVPRIGYAFDYWSGDIKEKKSSLKIRMEKNLNAVAHFKKNPKAPLLISKGKKAEASSVESTFTAKNVTDGNSGTRWSSQFSDPQWISLDLGKVCLVQAVRLSWETAYGRQYDIEVSLDGKNWQTVKELTDTDGGIQEIWIKPVKARYVRMYGRKRATSWGYSLFEFEVFGNDKAVK